MNFLVMSAVQPQWLQDIQSSYLHDPLAQQLLTQLAVHPDSDCHYSLVHGIIKYDDRIWLGSNTTLHKQVLQPYIIVLWADIRVVQQPIIGLNIYFISPI